MTLHNEFTFEIQILETLENFKIESDIDLDYFLLKQNIQETKESLKEYIFYLLKQIEDIKKTNQSIIEEKDYQIEQNEETINKQEIESIEFQDKILELELSNKKLLADYNINRFNSAKVVKKLNEVMQYNQNDFKKIFTTNLLNDCITVLESNKFE